MNNLRPLDCEHSNIVNTIPWPKVTGTLLETDNGLSFDFIEPGHKMRIIYKSKDESTHFDIMQTGMCPALPRGHVMAGEYRDRQEGQKPGGLEQLMHCVGDLVLNWKHYKIDCYPARDRSWGQVRTEDEVTFPPIGWSPVCFGKDFCFNQVGIEDYQKNKPDWEGVFQYVKSKPSHHFSWLVRGGTEVRNVVRVHRKVLEYHPELHSAIKQEIELEDNKGERYFLKGEAIAVAQLPSWPNNMFVDSVYRWEDDKGRMTYCTYRRLGMLGTRNLLEENSISSLNRLLERF
ncbi:hypothetical protein AOQ84DRAFT_372035 [Glonium stellatum]|uniref:Uncharacterized protein n=1 Tax=Glonium stellatum TaxID=574774 RepID=A0A8E2JYA7_9PEZI|nr:hypothetical protein AOQ84DRAFT_372035 [Glonium stellatum]